MTAWNLLAATGALLAYLVGLMTLAGRERKSPYVINRVILAFLLCLTGGAVDLLSLIPLAFECIAISDAILLTGILILLLAFAVSFGITYNVFIRFNYFVDHVSWKNLPGISFIRRKLKELNHKPSYEYNPMKFPDSFDKKLDAFLKAAEADMRGGSEVRALCIRAQHLQQTDARLVELSIMALSEGMTVQYLTASRHPIGFVSSLKSAADAAGLDFGKIAKALVVIDAYSPHYAFLDSVYPKKTREVESLGISVVTAKALYAGIHTAAGRAFNILKARAAKDDRLPTLVIYEDPYALVDLESAEQYRIFVRHVLPSERLWVGMFTVVVESAQPDLDWQLLQAYADVVIDLTKGAPRAAGSG